MKKLISTIFAAFFATAALAESSTITLDAKGGSVSSTALDLPAASLPTPTREGCHFVGWFKDEVDADTTKGYVRGTYLFGVSASVSNLVKTLSWCSLGTSITDFNDNPIQGRTQGYQFYAMDKLGWDRGKLTNAGHSGTLISSSSSKPPDTPCDIYTVEYGVNDWCRGHDVGTLEDYKNYLYNGKAVRWNNFAACYRNLIEMIRKVNSDAIIILITPRKAYGSSADAGTKIFPSNCDDPTLASSVYAYYDPSKGSNVSGSQTYLKDYADLIKAIGEYEGFPVVDWYAYAATEENLASLSVDVAVHPNDAGYEIMAEMLAPKILEAVAIAQGETPITPTDPIDPTDSKLTLNPNGGSVSSTAISLPSASLPTPTRSGYHFVGWFEDKTLSSYDYTPGGNYQPGTFLYGSPVIAPTADYAGKTLYAKWVKESVYNHFRGKKVAVYGDSVSTLVGFVPSAESDLFNGGVFYGAEYVDKGINEHTHWWGQLVDALGMELLQVNAIGGSSVGAYAYEYGLERKAMMNYTRMRLLDDAGTPDVILVAAGINDYNDKTDGFVADASYLTGDLDRVTSICPSFAKAYALMIRRLQDLYPSAEIIALSSFDVGMEAATETGNDCIRKTCALYNVVNIDMRNAFTLNDGSGVNYRAHGIHPGVSGLSAIANCFLDRYAPIENPVDVPACGHTWGFGELTTPATASAPGIRTFTCRHCGVTKTEEVAYVSLAEGTPSDITSQCTVKGVYLLPDDRAVSANTVNKQVTPLVSYNGYLESPANLIDGNVDTVYKDWILNDRYIAFTFAKPMVVTSVKLVGERNKYPNRIQLADSSNRLLGKTEGGIPWNSAAGQHQCEIAATEKVANSEVRLAFDFEYTGKEFQLREVQIFGYPAEESGDPTDPIDPTAVVALRNIAVATAVGSVPSLPSTVAGLTAEGQLAGSFEVVWTSLSAPTEEGLTTIAGSATVNGASLPVTASVRAVMAPAGEPVNISPNATPTTTAQNKNFVRSLIAEERPDPNNHEFITTMNGANLTDTLTWGSPVVISKIRVHYWGNNNYKAPSSFAFSADDVTIPPASYAMGEVGSDVGLRWVDITFASPIPMTTLECTFGAANGWIDIQRIWAYELQGGGAVEPLAADTLSALEVDGAALPGFDPAKLAYSVNDAKAITSATANENMGITILPKSSGSAYVVTLAEDGVSTKTYAVAMPTTHEHAFGPWEVVSPATFYANGLRRRACTFPDCTLVEEEVLPMITRKTVDWFDQLFETLVDSYLPYVPARASSNGRDATIRVTAIFQKPNDATVPEEAEKGQTAVLVFPDGSGASYKAWTADGWVKLAGAVPKFNETVEIRIDIRYEAGQRAAKVSVDGSECAPEGAVSPWFALAGDARHVTKLGFVGAFELLRAWGEYLLTSGLVILFS